MGSADGRGRGRDCWLVLRFGIVLRFGLFIADRKSRQLQGSMLSCTKHTCWGHAGLQQKLMQTIHISRNSFPIPPEFETHDVPLEGSRTQVG